MGKGGGIDIATGVINVMTYFKCYGKSGNLSPLFNDDSLKVLIGVILQNMNVVVLFIC